jgi:hypothetical protein
MVGLAAMLTTAGASTPSEAPPAEAAVERREIDGATFEIRDSQQGARLVCTVMGRPSLLATASYSQADTRALTVRSAAFSVGLGAFGEDFETARERFGEFLAVSGAAAAQPTDGTNFPDYMVTSGSFVPQLTLLYGLTCEGGFSKVVRFEGAGPVAIGSILATCLEASGASTAGVVVLAESAGLMGATLKRPPVCVEPIFEFPRVRQWLSFSAERCFAHSLVLAAGVITTESDPVLKPFVRPVARGSALTGHVHAAAFAYRPLPKGQLDMKASVTSVFEAGGLQGVVHLLADDRNVPGGGESELLRGACWVAPIAEIRTSEVSS